MNDRHSNLIAKKNTILKFLKFTNLLMTGLENENFQAVFEMFLFPMVGFKVVSTGIVRRCLYTRQLELL